MKRIYILSAIFFSGLAFSQGDNRYVYEEQDDSGMEEKVGEYPAAPGAPIDDYIPVLIAAAVGIAAFYGRKRIITK